MVYIFADLEIISSGSGQQVSVNVVVFFFPSIRRGTWTVWFMMLF